MMIQGGYAPVILRVALDTGAISREDLPEEAVLRAHVGGTGLGLYYLLREAPPDATATDPRTPLIFMTGPLAGTPAPSSSNYVVVTLHYETPYAAATGHAHGFWAAYLKHAGYEGLLITGASPQPVYLWIDDQRVELRDARHLWGQDTRETERRIKAELGGDPDRISVACIGPAGEALLHGASIKNDRNHGAGKGSPGAVMGAKKLKAIAVRGSGRVPLARPQAFLEAVRQWEANLFLTPEGGVPPASVGVRRAGITRIYHVLGKASLLAGKNLSDPQWGRRYGQNFVEGCARWRVTPRPSYNCQIECAYDVHITSGPFAGMTVSPCGGGENTEGAAAMIGVEDPGAALCLTEFYDAMGLESSTAGCVVAMAFEAYNRGLLTPQDTGGLHLQWGDYEAAMTLIEQMIRREGFGAVLAQGLKGAAAALGRGVERFTVHIKGGGINLHDWRAAWSVLFGQIIAGAGVCWQAPGVDALAAEPDLGYLRYAPGTVATLEEALEKVTQVRRTQLKKLWEDCLGVCWFATWGVKDVLRLAPQALAAAVGWEDFTPEEALAVGERVANLMRLVYVQRGFTKADEFDVSPRLLEPPPSGRAQGKSLAPFLPQMVDEYYRQMGWHVETGIPTRATLARLGLEAYADRLR
ncbi:MAG: aldehyde ferredoxin oxidoreductase [Candidatus Tectimicrobiota bacterium]|nr:MAG: aldehyde ferredoxin oxidoreductase [Candidatus Tectomicrobia bacterium]